MISKGPFDSVRVRMIRKLLVKMGGRTLPEKTFAYIIAKEVEHNRLKKTAICISFDCEGSKDILALPLLLKLLDKYKIKASFACIGKLIEEYPEEHEAILKKGHEILNHTYTHPEKFGRLSLAEKEREIVKCHKACKDTLGYDMVGFRAPHFGTLNVKDIYGILQKLGYKYSSNIIGAYAKTFGAPYYEKEILELPVSVCPAHPWTTIDSYHSFTRNAHRKDFEAVFHKLLKTSIDNNLLVNVYFDPIAVHEKDFESVLKLLNLSKKRFRVLRLRDFARMWFDDREK